MYFHYNTTSLADPGGAAGAPPQQDPFLLFSHTFSPKSVHVRGWRPPTGRRPPPPPTGNPGSATEHHTITFLQKKKKLINSEVHNKCCFQMPKMFHLISK